MDNKRGYYTPGIEDLYIGSEVWVLCDDNNYHPHNINSIGMLKYAWGLLKEGDVVKCKHLDDQDIIDCGFTKSIHKEFSIRSGNVKIWYYTNNKIDVFLGNRVCIQTCGYPSVLFSGTIKNKSELRRILKMIGHETENNS